MEYSLSYVFFLDTSFKILFFCTVFHDGCHMPYHSFQLHGMIQGTVLALPSLFLFFANVSVLRALFMPHLTPHFIPSMSLFIKRRRYSAQEKARETLQPELSTHSEIKRSQNSIRTLYRDLLPVSCPSRLKKEEPWACCEPPTPALASGVEHGVCSRH